MNIIAEMIQKNSTTRAAALATYRELLPRLYDAQPGDAAAMSEAMDVLGIATDDAERDYRALAEMTELQGKLLSDERIAELDDGLEQAETTYRAECKKLATQILDVVELRQLEWCLNQLVGQTINGTTAEVTAFQETQRAIFAKVNAVFNERTQKMSLQDQYQREASDLRAQHRRVFL